MKQVVVRVDASHRIGHGHVMRCLTLASALRQRGAEIRFVCREHPGHLNNLIASSGFAVHPLPWSSALPEDDRAGWLGATADEDAAETRNALESFGTEVDWLVSDHYAIDDYWERTMRPRVDRIMVIDDLADRPHDCDLLLDQNVVARMRTRYEGKVPESCVLLLGAEYAIIQPTYVEARQRLPVQRGPIKRIFIYFGGADTDNLTSRSLSSVIALGRSDIEVDLVVSRTSPHLDVVRRQVAGRNNLRLHTELPTLAPLMAEADLGIGAAGATSWERLCLGLPCVVITLAANQVPVANELSRLGFIHYLGHKDQVTAAVIEARLRLLTNQTLDPAWSARCMNLWDGEGTGRIVRSMTACSHPFTARREYQ